MQNLEWQLFLRLHFPHFLKINILLTIMTASRYVVSLIFVFLFKCSSEQHSQSHTCGRPLGSGIIIQSDRVVAGYDVGYYRYSWYAALMRQKQVSCGGALIAPKTILTAAHCFKEFMEANNTKLENVYTVKLGMYNICTTESTLREYNVEKVHVHDLYLSKKPYYDIALLILTNNTDQYDPICLPKAGVTKKPKEGTVPGMGTLKYQGAMPCTLHEARLLIYPEETCKNMIKKTGNDEKAIKNAFCAGYLNGGIDTCQGDSGGPLQVVDENGNYIVIGIVSFGFHCAVPGYLGLYTDVSQYINWIKEKSGSDIDFLQSIAHNNTSSSSSDLDEPESTSPGHKKKKKHVHHERPYRAPIRIIILKDNNLVSITKPVLHHSVKRRH